MVDKVINAVCEVCNVTLGDIKSKSRKQEFVYARFIICHLLREYGLKLQAIGYIINKNHATVLYDLKSYLNEYQISHMFKDIANKVNAKIKEAN